MAEKWILHYAGEKFPFDSNPLEGVELHTPATITLDRGNGKSLTIATGPGVEIAVQNLGERPERRPARIL
jgi:hypothetical protein